jgi:hypothetical protein
VKYPKLAAAIDEMLAKQVAEYGETVVAWAIASLSKPVEAVPEKLPPVPVTKEEVVNAD